MIWKIINEFPDYKISNFGNVKRIKKSKQNNVKLNCLLSPRKDHRGYLYINLYRNRRRFTRKIHRLVFETFNGKISKEINHKDGDKENNFIDNLEDITKSENIKHAYENGLMNHIGENHNRAKLTNSDIYEIRKLADNGLKQKVIAKIFGVAQQTVSKIVNKRRWNHL